MAYFTKRQSLILIIKQNNHIVNIESALVCQSKYYSLRRRFTGINTFAFLFFII